MLFVFGDCSGFSGSFPLATIPDFHLRSLFHQGNFFKSARAINQVFGVFKVITTTKEKVSLVEDASCVLFRPLKVGSNFVFGFFSFFHSKSGPTNNHRTGLSDISKILKPFQL